MISGKRVLALVPARSGSKGLPNKNVRLLQGMPLLSWPINAAIQSRYVDRVVASTDSEEYAKLARVAGADVPFLRPAELSVDTAPSIDFILHALDVLEAGGDIYDYVVLLEPTSPLTDASDIDAALENLVAHRTVADAIVSVAELVATHPAFAVVLDEAGLMHPYSSQSFGLLPRRQDIKPLYSLDGSLYVSTTDALRLKKGFCHERTLSHVMPRYKSFEVDDLVDFICIEAVLAKRDIIKKSSY